MKKRWVEMSIILVGAVALVGSCSLLSPGDPVTFMLNGQTLEDGAVLDFGTLTGLGDPPVYPSMVISITNPKRYTDSWNGALTSTEADLFGLDEIYFGGYEHMGTESGTYTIQLNPYDTPTANGTKTATLAFTDNSGGHLAQYSVTANLDVPEGRLMVAIDESIVPDGESFTYWLYRQSDSFPIAGVFNQFVGQAPSNSLTESGLTAYVLPELSLVYPFFSQLGAAALPSGTYSLQAQFDQDVDNTLSVGERGYFQTVVIDGDTRIDLTDGAKFVAAFDETINVADTTGLPDGILYCVYLVPGGQISDQSIVGWKSLVVASEAVSQGIWSPMVPGTYDLYCFLDVDAGANPVVWPIIWDNDPGELEAYYTNVVVSGSGIDISASALTPIP